MHTSLDDSISSPVTAVVPSAVVVATALLVVYSSVSDSEVVVVSGEVIVGLSTDENISLKPFLDLLCRGPEWNTIIALCEVVLIGSGFQNEHNGPHQSSS